MPTIPAWAVIDARNLLGQCANHVSGTPRFTSAGIRSAMANYGFDVQHLSVGIGLARDAKANVLQEIHATNSKLIAELRAEGAHILEGELRLDVGKPVEKMVDVRCALEVARLAHGDLPPECRAILIFSRDLDLLPAAQYASSRGVKTYVVSDDIDYLRSQHRVLLTTAGYQMLAGDATADRVHGPRVAAFLRDPGPHDWIVGKRVHLQGRNGYELIHESGVRGFIEHAGDNERSEGDLATLLAVDAIFEQNHAFVFCSEDIQLNAERPWLIETSVLRRLDATFVEIGLAGVVTKMRCVVGAAEAEQPILVRTNHAGAPYKQQAQARLIGPLEVPEPSALETGRLSAGCPTLVRIVHIDTNKTITARTEAEQKVRVNRSFGVSPRISHWYAAVPVGTTGQGTRSGPSLQLVSTELFGI